MRFAAFVALLATLSGAFCFTAPAVAQDAEEIIEKKLEDVDVTDPDAMFEVAQWAMEHKKKKVQREGVKLMREVIELDEDHVGARKALGHIKVGDTWYKNKKKAQKALKELQEEEMNAKGYVWWSRRGNAGWIKETLKRQWNKEWVLGEDNIWLSPDDLKRAQGFVKFGNAWLKVSDSDRKAIEEYADKTGEEIIVVTTEHFVLHLSTPPDYVEKYAELVEKIYDWFMDEFEIPEPRRSSFFGPGRKPHIWSFKNLDQLHDWITYYTEGYKITGEDQEHMRKRAGGSWLRGGGRNEKGEVELPLATHVAQKAEDLENQIANDVGMYLSLYWSFGPGGAWLHEAFGNLVEHIHCGNGHVNHSNRSKYGNGGDVAKKDFTTKDSPDRAFGLVRSGDAKRMADLIKIQLNSLTGDDLTKGYSVVDWLYHQQNHEALRKLYEALSKRVPVEQALAEAIGAKDLTDFDKQWEKFVKKTRGRARS